MITGPVLPCTQAFVDRMRKLDPTYLSQVHQQRYVWRLDQWQRVAPCSKEHEHCGGCYEQPVLDEVYRMQTAGDRT